MVLIFLSTPATRAFFQVEFRLAHNPERRDEVLDEFDRILRGLPTPPHRNPLIRGLLEELLVTAKTESGQARKKLRMEL